MTNALPIGYILQNEYKIEQVLGAGGFGITYLARDVNLNYLVVIKEFLPHDMATREQTKSTVVPFTKNTQSYEHLLKRFSEEAQLLAKMHHPNVVKVTRFFRANNTAYFVMEYAEGETLKSYLQKHPSLNEEEILSIMMPVLEGTKYVHQQGFLHRDIAPDNIYLTKNGMPLLIDFGAARDAIAEESKNISAIVKEGYSAPEQYTVNNTQNASADIYALGAVFYRLITGKAPVGASQRQMAVLNGERDPLEESLNGYSGRYSAPLLQAVAKALNLKPQERFASVSAFQQALLGTPVAAPASAPDSGNSTPVKKPGEKPGEKRSSGGNRGILIFLVVLLLLLIAGLAYVVLTDSAADALGGQDVKTEVSNIKAAEEKAKGDAEAEKRRQAELERERLKREEAQRAQKEADMERIRREKAELERQKREAELERLRREKEEAQREIERLRLEREKAAAAAAAVPQKKTMAFSENGIDIAVTYPSFIRAGEKFRIVAKMTNRYGRVRQGGLTLSFPDIRGGLRGTVYYNSFTKIDAYAYPKKIWNKRARRALRAEYFMVEGWQSRPWNYGVTKSFEVELTAPVNLDRLRVNVRGVLWVTSKHNLRENPSYSGMYDQQGFAVKQFTIDIR